MQRKREKSPKKNPIYAVQRQLTGLIRNIVGRKWGNYVTLKVSQEASSITLQFRKLARNKLNRLKTAIRELAKARRDVRYCPQGQKVSLA